jgi:hypothetical protein
VCFVCQVEISQTMRPLSQSLGSIGKPLMMRLHQGNVIMLKPTMYTSYWKLSIFLSLNSFLYNDFEFLEELGVCFWYHQWVWVHQSGFKFGNYCILSIVCHWKFNKNHKPISKDIIFYGSTTHIFCKNTL